MRNAREDAGAYGPVGVQGACDGGSFPRPPMDPRTGCPIGRTQCQQELALDSYTTLAPGATDSFQFTPYRTFTPLSLWNLTRDPTSFDFALGLTIVNVQIGSRSMIKGELSADLFTPTIDRGHEVHWDGFDPDTPLDMDVRSDIGGGGADLSANLMLKGAAYRR